MYPQEAHHRHEPGEGWTVKRDYAQNMMGMSREERIEAVHLLDGA